MFVRITWSTMPTERIDALASNYRENILPSLRTQTGFLGGLVVADRTSGEGAAVTYWETAEAMSASEEMAAAGRAQATQASGGDLQILEVDRFEVVLQDRSAPVQAGTFVRVNDLQGATGQIDATIALIRDQATPLVRAQEGYRALLTMVNRETGRMLVSSAWDTAAAREASDAAVRGLRQQAGEIAQAQSVRVSQYETIVAEVSAAAQAGAATTAGTG